ncbi:signal recognition particle-docking protein FtsY, partial [bacterium]
MFNKWIEGLNRTRKVAFGRLATLFGATEISAETWDELEAILIQADLGVETTESILAALQEQVMRDGLTRTDELQASLRAELIDRLDPSPKLDLEGHKPAIVLVVGVNGSGKTTTIAKLGRQFALQGKKVLLAAADTYRAAAVDQLQVWGERLDLPVIAGQPEGDPGAVAYDAVQAGLSRRMDIVLIDTAGRLHTRFNLMEELKKVYRVVGKALPGAP